MPVPTALKIMEGSKEYYQNPSKFTGGSSSISLCTVDCILIGVMPLLLAHDGVWADRVLRHAMQRGIRRIAARIV
jgi:hypothetical protein